MEWGRKRDRTNTESFHRKEEGREAIRKEDEETPGSYGKQKKKAIGEGERRSGILGELQTEEHFQFSRTGRAGIAE